MCSATDSPVILRLSEGEEGYFGIPVGMGVNVIRLLEPWNYFINIYLKNLSTLITAEEFHGSSELKPSDGKPD